MESSSALHANDLTRMADEYLERLLAGQRHEAVGLVVDAVERGQVGVQAVYLDVLQVALREIGRRWENNEVSVAQEHFTTAVTQLTMSRLYNHIFGTEKHGGVMVATCVSGELHEVGLRMVSDFFELAGWDTFFLGSNMPASGVVDEAKRRSAELLAISVTLDRHMPRVEELISLARELPRPPKILVGGYPFLAEPERWRRVGADGFAYDAASAVALGNELTGREGALPS